MNAVLKLKGFLSLEKVVDKIAHSPATVYQVANRGYIRAGYWADLVLVNLNANTKIDDKSTLYKCGWSPFSGSNFSSRIDKTFVNGVLKYSDNKIVADNLGKSLEFNHEF